MAHPHGHPPLSEHCQPLAHPHWLPVTLASFVLVGVVLSYIPQHWKIIRRRSSAGIAPLWVLLGSLSSIAAIGNILTLPTSRADMACCKTIGAGACVAAMLGLAQIAFQWGCFMFIVTLFIAYYPQQRDLERPDAPQDERPKWTVIRQEDHRVTVFGFTFLALLIVGITSTIMIFANPDGLQSWANILGIFAGVTAAVQYAPQILTTWRLKDAKSLSIVTMSIQVPGALVLALSLGLRVGWQGWSTWFIYVLTAAMQAVVLTLALYYQYRRRPSSSTGSSDSDSGLGHNASQADGADERTALLGSQPAERPA